MRTSLGLEKFEADLGGGLTEGQLYIGSFARRDENLFHLSFPGHVFRFGVCPTCGNCRCGKLNYTPIKTFNCYCASGMKQVTATILRPRWESR